MIEIASDLEDSAAFCLATLIVPCVDYCWRIDPYMDLDDMSTLQWKCNEKPNNPFSHDQATWQDLVSFSSLED